MDGLKLAVTTTFNDICAIAIASLPENLKTIRSQDVDFDKKIVKGESSGYYIKPVLNTDGSKKNVKLEFTPVSDDDLSHATIKIIDPELYGKQILSDACTKKYRFFSGDKELQAQIIDKGNGYSKYLFPPKTSVISIEYEIPLNESITSISWPTLEIEQEWTPETLNINLDKFENIAGANTTSFSLDKPDFLYDIDNDGIKESILGNIIYKFDKDFTKTTTYTLNDYNRSKVVGLYPGYTQGNTLLYSSKRIDEIDKDYVIHNLYEFPGSYAFMDYNNDGRIDIIDSYANTAIIFNEDLQPIKESLNVINLNQAVESISMGWCVMFVGRGGSTPASSFAQFVQTDLNGDGYQDFLDLASGNFYIRRADGSLVNDSYHGQVYFRDFDGDGVNDLLSYADKTLTLVLNRFDGEIQSKKLVSGLNCSKDIWCHDFDNDGDVDILVPFNASLNNGISLLVMFENDGKGNFKKKEYPFDEALNFIQCYDWDADGKFEVMCEMTADEESFSYYIAKMPTFEIDGLKIASQPEYIIQDEYRVAYGKMDKYSLCDIDNSGKTRIIAEGFSSGMFTVLGNLNTRPSIPVCPSLYYDEVNNELTVSWQRGSDKETPSADLTYELRIGTSPYADDILAVAADAQGNRKAVGAGNCGYALTRKFNTKTWPEGKIYVSLQAIDDGGLGSEFSQNVSFEITKPAADFIIEAPLAAAVGETIKLSSIVNTQNGQSVTWFADGAEIVEQYEQFATIYFKSSGVKEVSMIVKSPTGAQSIATKQIDIAAVRLESYEGYDTTYDYAFDIDCDGSLEVHNSIDYRFYQGNTDGGYSMINRMFNYTGRRVNKILDVNRDGIADVFYQTDAINAGYLINEGDLSMEDENHDELWCFKFLIDLDNDGVVEAWNNWSRDGIYKDYGDGKYVKISNSGLPDLDLFINVSGWDGLRYYDYNHDGLFDIFYPGYKPAWYENLGDMKFAEHPLALENIKSVFRVGDYDGNGNPDYICIDNYNNLVIVYDDGSSVILTEKAYSAEPACDLQIDIDNNGCNDLITRSPDRTIYLFNKDHTFEKVAYTDNISVGYYDIAFLGADDQLRLSKGVMHCAPNNKPEAPTDLKAEVVGNDLVVSWSPATDAETPSEAMRYNLLVKLADTSGEGAYIISPLNGGINGVNLPSDAALIQSTRYPISLSVLKDAKYEIKVQAVDGRRMVSDFSQPITVSVVTGIDDVVIENQKDNPQYYDVMGRRVEKPSHGVFIQKGKKIIL